MYEIPYLKHVWQPNELIRSEWLNHIENQLEGLSDELIDKIIDLINNQDDESLAHALTTLANRLQFEVQIEENLLKILTVQENESDS